MPKEQNKRFNFFFTINFKDFLKVLEIINERKKIIQILYELIRKS